MLYTKPHQPIWTTLFRRVVGVFCLVLAGVALQAQQFSFQNYSIADGLAQSQVFTLLEDSRGYIWMGTQGGGVSRFDGDQFESYSVRDGLSSNFINSLIEDEAGNIWIGTKDGLTKYDGWTFEDVLLENKERFWVSDMEVDEQGQLWMATNQGIYTYQDSLLAKIESPTDVYQCIVKDTLNHIWIGGQKGLYHYLNNQVEKYESLPVRQISTLEVDAQNRLWVGTFNRGVYVLGEEEELRYTAQNGLADNTIYDIESDANGNMWIASQRRGLSVWAAEDSTFTYLNQQDGLAKNDVRAVIQDSWGAFWMGTSGGGVSRYFGQQFEHFDKDDGLPAKFVYAVEEDTSGGIWLSVYNKGVVRYDGTSFEQFNEDTSFVADVVKAIHTDKTGRTWLGTSGSGLAYYDSTFHYVFQNQDVYYKFIKDIVEDQNEDIFIASAASGIGKLMRDTFATSGYRIDRYGRGRGVPSDGMNCLHVDKLNRLWFGTRNRGLGYYDIGQDAVIYTRDNGLPSNDIRTIAEDSTGLLWIGTPNGVSKLNMYADSLYFENYRAGKEITYNNIYLIGIDEANNVWVGSQKGVDRIELDADRNIKDVQFFGQKEGFEGIETCSGAFLSDTKGALWFGTMNGLTKYSPGRALDVQQAPKIHFKGVRLFYKYIRDTKYAEFERAYVGLKDSFELTYRENNLGFEFEAINLPDPEEVRYQWQLIGTDSTWLPPRSANEVNYTNLDFGAYTFSVRAVNEDGIASAPISTSFTIKPPFWRLLWVQLLAALVGLFALFRLVRWRTNRVRRKAKEQQERLEMEKNVLELEQKALQLQMNPHFIFNALNTVQGHIATKDTKTARYQLAKFSKLMRATLENSRLSSITLEEEINVLKDYLSLEQSSRGDAFDWDIQVADDLDTDELSLPPMMLQPFVENAIIHGFTNLNGRGNINIEFAQEGNNLLCRIKDNGIGRAASKKVSAEPKAHQSMALTVTQERLAILNPDVDNALEINDLEQGTEVVVRMPIG